MGMARDLVKMFGKDVASFRDLAGFGKEAQDPQTSVEKLGHLRGHRRYCSSDLPPTCRQAQTAAGAWPH